MSENIWFICTSFKKRFKNVFLAYLAVSANRFYFQRQYTYILFILQKVKKYWTTQILPERAKTGVVLAVFKGVLYHCYHFLPLIQHESGTKKALLGPWLNNTEVYWTPLLLVQATWLQDKFFFYFSFCQILTAFKSWRLCQRLHMTIERLKLFTGFQY